jgi:hypothetical protein
MDGIFDRAIGPQRVLIVSEGKDSGLYGETVSGLNESPGPPKFVVSPTVFSEIRGESVVRSTPAKVL